MSRGDRTVIRLDGLWRRGAGTPDDPDNGRLILRLLGINAWLCCRHFSTRTARLRGMYWWLIRGYEYELCQHCGRPVRLVFHVPDAIWTLVAGTERSGAGEAGAGVLCPRCVDELYTLAVPRGPAGFLRWTCRPDDSVMRG